MERGEIRAFHGLSIFCTKKIHIRLDKETQRVRRREKERGRREMSFSVVPVLYGYLVNSLPSCVSSFIGYPTLKCVTVRERS